MLACIYKRNAVTSEAVNGSVKVLYWNEDKLTIVCLIQRDFFSNFETCSICYTFYVININYATFFLNAKIPHFIAQS